MFSLCVAYCKFSSVLLDLFPSKWFTCHACSCQVRSMKSKLDQTMHEITLPFQPNTFIASWLLISMTNCAAQVAEAPKIADLPTVT